MSRFCPNSRQIALNFDAADGSTSSNSLIADYCEVPYHDDYNVLDGNFTVSVWIKNTNEYASTIVTKGRGNAPYTTTFDFRVMGGDNATLPQHRKRLGLYIAGEWRYSTSIIPNDEWIHVAASFEKDVMGTDGTNEKHKVSFYINGLVDGPPKFYTTANLLTNNAPNGLWIGRQGYAANINNFDGSIAELMLWDRALKNEEIYEYIVKPPVASSEFNLVAWFKFRISGPLCGNAGPYTTLFDFSINSNHATLHNFALNNTCVSNWVTGPNLDFDNDGQGNECDDGLYCIPDYAGLRALTGLLAQDADYETNGIIESDQLIDDPYDVDYDSATEINLFPGFEVKKNTVLHAFIDGCGGPNDANIQATSNRR